jgi:hypothetical protein
MLSGEDGILGTRRSQNNAAFAIECVTGKTRGGHKSGLASRGILTEFRNSDAGVSLDALWGIGFSIGSAGRWTSECFCAGARSKGGLVQVNTREKGSSAI